MSNFSSTMKLDLKKLDEIINFGLWKIHIKDMLIQLGLNKSLKGDISNLDNEK